MENPYEQIKEEERLATAKMNDRLDNLFGIWTRLDLSPAEIETFGIVSGLFSIDFYIKQLKDLHTILKIVKRAFPEWKYDLQHIYTEGISNASVSWYDPDIYEIRVNLICSQKNFPKSLMKKGCSFILKETIPIPYSSYTCETPE